MGFILELLLLYTRTFHQEKNWILLSTMSSVVYNNNICVSIFIAFFGVILSSVEQTLIDASGSTNLPSTFALLGFWRLCEACFFASPAMKRGSYIYRVVTGTGNVACTFVGGIQSKGESRDIPITLTRDCKLTATCCSSLDICFEWNNIKKGFWNHDFFCNPSLLYIRLNKVL